MVSIPQPHWTCPRGTGSSQACSCRPPSPYFLPCPAMIRTSTVLSLMPWTPLLSQRSHRTYSQNLKSLAGPCLLQPERWGNAPLLGTPRLQRGASCLQWDYRPCEFPSGVPPGHLRGYNLYLSGVSFPPADTTSRRRCSMNGLTTRGLPGGPSDSLIHIPRLLSNSYRRDFSAVPTERPNPASTRP